MKPITMPKYIAALERDKKALTTSLKATEEVLLYWQKIASERSKEIDRLKAAISTPEVYAGVITHVVEEERDKVIAENTKLKEAVGEALSMCQAEWDAVGNHPASSHAKDVAYFKGVLGKAEATKIEKGE